MFIQMGVCATPTASSAFKNKNKKFVGTVKLHACTQLIWEGVRWQNTPFSLQIREIVLIVCGCVNQTSAFVLVSGHSIILQAPLARLTSNVGCSETTSSSEERVNVGQSLNGKMCRKERMGGGGIYG